MWGPGTRSMWHEWQTTAARGYVVFFCNPRGSEGYGELWRDGIRRAWGENDAPDILAGIDRVIEMDPQNAQVHFNLGMLYREAGESFPGMTALDAYQRAVTELNRYRELMGPRLARDDPSQTYLDELGRLIQREQARIERERARAEREAERAARQAAEQQAQ